MLSGMDHLTCIVVPTRGCVHLDITYTYTRQRHAGRREEDGARDAPSDSGKWHDLDSAA